MTRQIYVASLSDYNAGNLHGAWIETEGKDADELQDEVNEILRSSKHPNVMVECPSCMVDGYEVDDSGNCKECGGKGEVPSAEEYAIHDHEGFGDRLSEHNNLTEVAELETIFTELGDDEDDIDAYQEYASHVGGQPDVDSFRDAYRGVWEREEDYAVQLFDELYLHEVPESIQHYIDYEKFSRDLFINDCFSEPASGGRVHVFWRN